MGTVIKAGEATTLLRRLTTVDLADHLAEARAVLQAARDQAKEISENARKEANRLRQEAERRGFDDGSTRGYEKGYSDGQTAGCEAGRQAAFDEAMQRYNAECAHLVADFQKLVVDFDARKEELLVSTEGNLLDFSVKLASKLTFAVGALHRQAALANVDRAVRLVGLGTDLTVRVHPEDVAAIETFAREVLEQSQNSRAVKVVSDDSFAPGGCKLQTDRVDVDATLETQINEIVELLLGRQSTHA